MGIYFAKDRGRRRPKIGIDGNPRRTNISLDQY
jgi:hypothetical protein